jgi:hypothetical protein
MARKLDDIFNECYERIRSGESLESCLRSYPQYRSQLEPLLRTTFDIGRRASFIQPRPEFRHWARVRFESALQYPRQQQPSGPQRVEAPVFSTWLRHGWAVIVSAGIVLLLGAGSTMAASSNALPTETLYPVKQLTEEVQRVMAVSPERKAEFETDIANIRAAELQAMANAGNAEEASKAAVRYDDQFERAIQAILQSEGTEQQATAPVPPAPTTPAVTSPPVTTPPVTTPPVTTPEPVTQTPPVTPTPEIPTPVVTITDNSTIKNTGTENTTQPGTTTPPAVIAPSENTTPPATSAVTPDTGEQPPNINNQPATTEEQPAITSSTDSTQSDKAKNLRDKLNRHKSTVEQSLKEAQDKAPQDTKSDWQAPIDTVSKKTATRGSSGHNDSHNQSTTQSDNNTSSDNGSYKNKSPLPNRHH